MTDEQKQEVEKIVNQKIAEDLPVIHSEMPREEAEKLGAEHEFGQKYPDRVSVYSIGPREATLENPQFDKAFSIEFSRRPARKPHRRYRQVQACQRRGVLRGRATYPRRFATIEG